MVKLAAQAGITGYHLAEHHGTDLCLAPIQGPFLAAAGAVTSNIRVGPLVKLLPLHHPLAIIEELVALDNLTDGRVDFGVGRGVVPSEHLFFDQPWQYGRDRFQESLEIVLQGLRTGRIDSEGRKFFHFPPVALDMRPVQTPNPPFWYPGDPVSAGRRGMACLTFSRITPAARATYLEAWESTKGEPNRADGPDQMPMFGTAEVAAVAPTKREAEEIAARGKDGLRRRILFVHQHYDRANLSEDEFGSTLTRSQREGDRPEDVARAAPTSAPIGTIEQVVDHYIQYAEERTCDYVALQFPTGDMTFAEAMRSLELIGEHVLPAVAKVAP